MILFAESGTSFPGENQIDGLPPASGRFQCCQVMGSCALEIQRKHNRPEIALSEHEKEPSFLPHESFPKFRTSLWF